MKLTQEINQAIARIHEEDHVVHKGLRDSLFESVGAAFDKPGDAAFFPLRPSGCLKPLRDLYYDLQNYYAPKSVPKEDFEPRVKLIFEFGHVTETLLKKLFSQNFEVLFEQEKVCYGSVVDSAGEVILLTGSIDWAVKLDSFSTAITLCDAKSIGDYPFKSAPKEDNIAQMQLYMHSDWGRKHKVDKALLIYFNKNNSDLKCIQIDYDSGLACKLLKRLQMAYDYYKKSEVPPREYLAGLDWRADYSSYKDWDNREFGPEIVRNKELVDEFHKPSKYVKDDIRTHVEKYGNKLVYYLDKKAYIVYYQGKLTMQIETFNQGEK